MRKLVPVAAAIATSVSVVALPAALAYAAAPVHVLTINKVGGPAVKVGAVLKSGLAKGKTAVFSLGSEKLTCKSANFSAPVKVTVSDATGLPVTVKGTSKTKPIKVAVKVALGTTRVACTYKASSVKG